MRQRKRTFLQPADFFFFWLKIFVGARALFTVIQVIHRARKKQKWVGDWPRKNTFIGHVKKKMIWSPGRVESVFALISFFFYFF